MTAGATAITIFHPPTERSTFDSWATELIATAQTADGFVGARVSAHDHPRLDWAVEVTFDSIDQLDAWLDGHEREAALRNGEARGHWRRATDLILPGREPSPAGVAVFVHNVAAGAEPEFVAAHGDLTRHTGRFPGYEGTAVFPPDSSGQWMSVLRYRTAHQLNAWLRSPEREKVLPGLRAHLTRNFSELPRTAPFGSTVRVEDGQTRITPAWKTAMVVVLCLYPTVMLVSKSLAPALERVGLEPSVTVFVGNVVSVALLTWVLVPTVSRAFRRWLDPVDGTAPRITLIGVAVIVGLYAALLGLFALVA